MRRVTIGLLIAATLAGGCGGSEKPADEARVLAPVTVTPVALHHFVESVEGSGTIAALPEAVTVISAFFPGRVATLPVHVGARVNAGDPVCEVVLDPLGAAEIERLRRTAVQADRALARQRSAVAAGVSPRIALEQAEVDASNARAELHARTRDYAAGTQRQTLRAPVAGLVTALGARVGQEVDSGTPVVTLVDPERLAANVRFDAAAASRIAVGQVATVAALDAGATPFRAVVLRTAGFLDPASQRAEAWLEYGGGLAPGAFVRAVVGVGTRDDAAVPRSALVKTDRGYRVFVVAEGVAHAHDVEVGVSDGDLAEIREGVTVGEQVVSAGAQELADGMRVALRDGAP